MPLQLPNLDDRTYDDLMQEALGLLPTYGTDWTNYNPSDPGITLIEMFAYLTEILIYRLDRVTDANKQAFLNLITGVKRDEVLDSQTLNDEIRSAILKLRQSDRAVTSADFERWALNVEGIARVKCLPRRNLVSENPRVPEDRPGSVSVIIVPRSTTPLAELIQAVVDILRPRSLLTTKVHVVGPRFAKFRVQVKLHLRPDAEESKVKERAIAALEAMFAPTPENAPGWPFGRDIYVSEIYELLDRVEGVDFVKPRFQGNQRLPEVVPSNDLEGYRRQINRNNELVALKLDASELVQYQSQPSDIEVVRPTRQSLSEQVRGGPV
ncbi:MAG: hypothetical protein HC860_15485 [Alkalinema sp. RU_4_3]|nr:hypothetical protein [Alkalinema sp. RU_4_3]